jgi:hypothetical protein
MIIISERRCSFQWSSRRTIVVTASF